MNKKYFDNFPIIMPSEVSGMFEMFEQLNNSIFNKTTIKKFFPYPINIFNVVDNKENKNVSTIIEIALAGFTKDEISVTAIRGKSLTVKLMPKESILDSAYSHKYLTNGIAKREASISWALNVKVDLDKFKTTYKNGILTIALPLMKEEQTEEIISEIED